MASKMEQLHKELVEELDKHQKILGGGSLGTVRCSCGIALPGTQEIPMVLHAKHQENVCLEVIRSWLEQAYTQGYDEGVMDGHWGHAPIPNPYGDPTIDI